MEERPEELTSHGQPWTGGMAMPTLPLLPAGHSCGRAGWESTVATSGRTGRRMEAEGQTLPEDRPGGPQQRTWWVKQLILYWKYPLEEHYVITKDGYILNLFRIPHGRENNKTTSPKRVVFLQHGLLVDAACWYQNFPHNSLAFMLADAGYDVWLGNSRGNTWSKNHTSLSPFFGKFWEFSYDEMAKYDLPASIDFVLQKTGQQQIYYIGHSQGTTIAFIAFSSNKQLASKIKLYIALAPVATVKNAKTSLAELAKLSDTEIKILFGTKEFLPKTYFGTLFSTKVCSQEALASLCSNLLFVLCGFNEENLNMSRVDVYTSYVPAGTSVQNMIHWKQDINSGKLQAYNYGRFRNKFHYEQLTYYVTRIASKEFHPQC
ncbi:lipase member K-like [Vipera latastei]